MGNNQTPQKTKLTAIVLAAGYGRRMHSTLSKPLHPVAGIPMMTRIIKALKDFAQDNFIDLTIRVVTNKKTADQMQSIPLLENLMYIEQDPPNGTGDAVQIACNADPIDSEAVLILNADHPLITASHLKSIFTSFINANTDMAIVTAIMENPASLGRVVRKNGHIHHIVESHEAEDQILAIKEVNTGIYIAETKILYKLLPQLSTPSAKSQTEVYLTGLIPLFKQKTQKDVLGICMDEDVAYGVNSQQELAKATYKAFQRKSQALMDAGVTLIDPHTTYIEDDVVVETASVIHPNVFIKGKSHIGKNTIIEPHCILKDVNLDQNVHVKAGSYLENTNVGEQACIGPYARLRPQTVIGPSCRIGNFVEIKKAKLGRQVKVAHLSYLGDVDIGSHVNIGCGVITCNYREDHKKYKTQIDDHAFVGSDVQLVAPVKVGQGAIIGSGSTITKDVPANSLAIGRAKQVIKPDWAKLKKRS